MALKASFCPLCKVSEADLDVGPTHLLDEISQTRTAVA